MSDDDGLDEALMQAVRVAMTSAARVGEALMRVRQDQQRQAAAPSTESARALSARLAAEQAAARTAYRGVDDPRWWDQATPENAAEMYATATAWREVDPEADRARGRLEDEVKRRYGVDVTGLDGNQVGPALADAEQRLRQEGGYDKQRAARDLAAADRADRAAGRHAGNGAESTDPAAVATEKYEERAATSERDDALGRADQRWDSAGRREATADELREKNIPAEAIEARMLADTSQAKPATAVTKQKPPKATKARAARGQSVAKQRDVERGLSR